MNYYTHSFTVISGFIFSNEKSNKLHFLSVNIQIYKYELSFFVPMIGGVKPLLTKII